MDLKEPTIGILFWQVLVIATFLLAVLCLALILLNRDKTNDKFTWIIVVLAVPFAGPILYLRHRAKKKKL
jgi:hypothetical protein